ncbi:MAG: ABC transporter permease, partial [Thermoleophilia bacterium]|nr:ABC transporter permease [Thermoleophilia bacterium]
MTLRGIGRNRRRTAFTMLGVVLALTLILVSWGMIDTTQILTSRQFDDIQRQDAQLYTNGPVSPTLTRQVEQTPGVVAVEPELQVPVTVSGPTGRYQTALVGLRQNTRMHAFIEPGGGRTTLSSTGVIAGQSLGGQIGAKRGGSVRIAASRGDAAFVAPVNAFVSEPLGTYVYASLDSLRAIAGADTAAGNSLLVRYRSGANRRQLQDRLSALSGVAAFEDSKTLQTSLNKYLGLFYAFVGIMLVFGSAMAFALMFNAMSSNIAERSTEVATLRAAGLDRRTLSRMITAENFLVTLAGIGPGLVVGYVVASYFMGSFSNDQFSFDLRMRGSTLVLSALAILLVSLLSQWPGLRAIARLDIARVVRERSL